jgi:hypothetical protein
VRPRFLALEASVVRSRRFALLTLAATVALALTMAGSAAASPSSPVIVLSKITLSGCNALTFGISDPNGARDLGNNSGSLCTPKSFARMTISEPQGTTFANVTLYLRDDTCGATYNDDGTGLANHATVGSGTKRRMVDIADGGDGCGTQSVTNVPSPGNGNLSLIEAIH